MAGRCGAHGCFQLGVAGHEPIAFGAARDAGAGSRLPLDVRVRAPRRRMLLHAAEEPAQPAEDATGWSLLFHYRTVPDAWSFTPRIPPWFSLRP